MFQTFHRTPAFEQSRLVKTKSCAIDNGVGDIRRNFIHFLSFPQPLSYSSKKETEPIGAEG
jgi:hypothetical protein